MDFFVRTVRGISTVCGVLAATALAAAVLVVCQMVVMRYFLGASTVWQTEFVTFAIVGATFMGSPYVLMQKGHVNVDLVPLMCGPRVRMALALFSALMSLAFCMLLAWAGWGHFHEALSGGWRTDTVWSLPLWIPLMWLPLGIGLVCLQYVADILCLLSGREAPFGLPAGRPR